MTSRITLTLNSKLIDKAKKISKKSGRSLSEVVEDFLVEFTSKSEEKLKAKKKLSLDELLMADVKKKNTWLKKKGDPLKALRRLKGIAAQKFPNVDYKDIVADAIIEKHLRRR